MEVGLSNPSQPEEMLVMWHKQRQTNNSLHSCSVSYILWFAFHNYPFNYLLNVFLIKKIFKHSQKNDNISSIHSPFGMNNYHDFDILAHLSLASLSAGVIYKVNGASETPILFPSGLSSGQHLHRHSWKSRKWGEHPTLTLTTILLKTWKWCPVAPVILGWLSSTLHFRPGKEQLGLWGYSQPH